jgi:hypothetical protein
MIHIRSTATLAKSFAVKREKTDDDSERVVAHLKSSDVLIDRDQLDEFCGQPIGWSAGALFDEFGAPRAHVTLTLHRCEWQASGVISGGEKSDDPKLRLKDADVDSLTLELTKMGALLACQLSWVAAGDEVDDIADLLGKLCAVDLVVTDGGQGDMLKPPRAVPSAIPACVRELGTITKTAEVCILLQQGYTLIQYGENSYRLDRVSEGGDAIERHECWLQAAKGAINRGLEGVGEADDEFGSWRWKEKAA